jgi:hypothetical protein
VRAFQDAAPAPDECRGDGFEKDALGCGLDHGLGPVLDVELFAQAKRDDDLSLRREPDGFELLSHTNSCEYDLLYIVCQYLGSRKISKRRNVTDLSVLWGTAPTLRNLLRTNYWSVMRQVPAPVSQWNKGTDEWRSLGSRVLGLRRRSQVHLPDVTTVARPLPKSGKERGTRRPASS